QGNGNGHDGNKGCAPVAQEKENDEHHQGEGDEDGFLHLENGLADEARAVEAQFQDDVVRNVLLDLLEPLVELIGDEKIVGARLGGHGQAYHRHAVLLENAPIVLGSQFGASDV